MYYMHVSITNAKVLPCLEVTVEHKKSTLQLRDEYHQERMSRRRQRRSV